jgi:hypothetical protein
VDERLTTFLDLPASSIGNIGGGRTRTTGQVDVAIIQSLVKMGVDDDRVGEYGYLTCASNHVSIICTTTRGSRIYSPTTGNRPIRPQRWPTTDGS